MLESADETWAYDEKSQLQITSAGKVIKGKRTHGIVEPVELRHTLYNVTDALYVDVELRGAQAALRRGVLNGHDLVTVIPSAEIPTVLARYRKLGFRDATPWHATKSRVTLRDYRKGSEQWTIHVDGTYAIENCQPPGER